MRQLLEDTDWALLEVCDPDIGAQYINDAILAAAKQCIPTKVLHQRKSTHPWLTEDIQEMVRAKQSAEGTPEERAAAERCSGAILK